VEVRAGKPATAADIIGWERVRSLPPTKTLYLDVPLVCVFPLCLGPDVSVLHARGLEAVLSNSQRPQSSLELPPPW